MTAEYQLPLARRVRSASARFVARSLHLIRAPFRRQEVVIVTGNARPDKVHEIENRIQFVFSHLDSQPSIRTVQRASKMDILLSAALVSANSDSISPTLLRRIPWTADLDYEANFSDGWALTELGTQLSGEAWRQSVAAGRRSFIAHIRNLDREGPRPVYLFGTGPSLASASKRSFEDGSTIVCNTIVRDPDLWHHLKPAFLTAGDAIYHFGHNPHARAFRADALRRLRESEGRTLFVYPATFDFIVRSEFSEVESLLVPIPFGEHTDITVDLKKHFVLPAVGNVLNALLLPLGCTVSKDVRLWGFDGRAPADSGFWANSNRHAYPELMDSIREAHPAFFDKLVPKGREGQYVAQIHGEELDNRLAEAEGRGFSFRMLHSTWTSTLQKRYNP